MTTSSYIETMRKRIGHAPLLLCGASAVIFSGERLLLQRRKDFGWWGHHGGSIELGERVEDAVRREVREETGLQMVEIELLGAYSGPEFHLTYPNGDEAYFVDIAYICQRFEGELRAQQSELEELQWFGFESLPENISPVSRAIIRDAIARVRI